ncbi:MAG: hypothetical protein ACTSPT_04380, partial [Candidatus Heimdallarchaeota archaeon]
MSLLQKYRKEETRKTTPEEEKGISPPKESEKEITPKVKNKRPLPPKQTPVKTKSMPKSQAMRSRPVISATVSTNLVEALNALTDEKYLNRSKFIEDALIRTIKAEFPDIAT